MNTRIQINKAEIASNDALLDRVRSMSFDLSIESDFVVAQPRPGRLFELLQLLRLNKIEYRTHFDINDELIRRIHE